MGTISVTLPSDGQTADAADYNTPINTIVAEINGGLDSDNITASAIGNTQLALGVSVQTVYSNSSAVSTGSTTIPNDDTIPQNTEGDEYMTLAITPKSTTNILVIEINAFVAAGASTNIAGALFQDTTADALAATMTSNAATANGVFPIVIRHAMVAGTTSSTTFKFRAGPTTAATVTFNGASGSRKFGAITKSSITITEYKAS